MKVVGWSVYGLVRCIVDVANALYFRTEIRGMGNIPREGSFMLVPVHRSNLDGPLVASLTRRRMRYLAKEEIFKYEFLGNIFRAMGAISVNRDAPDRKSLNYCRDEMDKGWPLVIFPEGGRRDGPIIEEVMDGAAYLALRANVPIVPVGIGGADRANPRKTLFFRPAKIRIAVGEPFVLPRGEGDRISRASISDGKELIRARMQELYDQAESGEGFHRSPLQKMRARLRP